jgi:hypothetical protein
VAPLAAIAHDIGLTYTSAPTSMDEVLQEQGSRLGAADSRGYGWSAPSPRIKVNNPERAVVLAPGACSGAVQASGYPGSRLASIVAS